MPYSIWSRALVLLTAVGAFITLLSWLNRPARLALVVVLALAAVQAVPVYGLYLCSLARQRKRVLASIEAHGGRLVIESSSRGAVVSFTLQDASSPAEAA